MIASRAGPTIHYAQAQTTHSASRRLVFWLKSRLLIARQMVRCFLNGDLFRRYRRLTELGANARLLAIDEHRLYTVTDARERDLELGKVHNLRIAAAAIDGIALARGELFSFWLAVGRPSRGKR